MNGYIKLHRKITEWGWYSDPDMSRIFIHFLLTANFRPSEWMGHVIKRGQLVMGREKLSKTLAISPRTIRTCLRRLKSTSEIAIETTNKFTIITICNYDIYQDPFCENDQQNDQQSDQQLTSKRPASDHILRREEGKKESPPVQNVELPANFPKDECQACQWAASVGCPDDFICLTWNKAASRGGRDSKDIPIRSWPRYVAVEWKYEKQRMAEQRQAPTPINGKPTAFTLKTQLDAIEDHISRIKNRFMTTDGCWMAGTDEAEKVKFRELVSKRKAVKSQMEALT